tara:strand:+ start:460 stop:900 length:441 start_codon:yes stop_codon:yes gene_type:complete
MAKIARTAAETTPKGFEGIDAIMRSEPGAMMETIKTVNAISPDAPYDLIAQEDSPTPRAESYAKEMIDEDHIPEERPRYTEEDIIIHNEKGLELEKFFKEEVKKAQKAVAKLSGKSAMKKVIRAAKPGVKPKPDTGGDSGDEDKKD